MALKAFLILATIGFVYSQSHCSAYESGYNDGQDCSCADRSFRECSEPSTDVQLHVASLIECKSKCDEIIDLCDWFIFDQAGGQETNCKLFGPGEESMADYLASCNVWGGPLRDEMDTCLLDPADMACNDNFCPGGCESCDGDRCSDLVETECVPTVVDSSTTNSIPSIATCQTVMTMQGLSETINYFTFDQRAKVCRGYPSGQRSCINVVAAQTISNSDIDDCRV